MRRGMRLRRWHPRTADGADSTRFYPDLSSILADLYPSSVSPYAGLERLSNAEMRILDSYPSSAKRNAATIARRIPPILGGIPQLIVEVGAFTGTSAAHAWAPLVGRDGRVLCVDTWLGDINMRMLPYFRRVMNVTHGQPTVGRLFLSRMLSLGLQEKVIPLALPSVLASRLIYLLGYRVDLVFVDSAHERGETLIELTLYWQLLRPGGVLMGDDYTLFPAVRHDVDIFARCRNVTIDLSMPNLWMLVKH